MSSSLKEWFQSADSASATSIMSLDGGVSTHLRDLHGKDFQHNELWSSSLLLDQPGRDTILQGHKDWLSAGSNVLTTVTYQCHSKSQIIDQGQMETMLREGVQLAQQAIKETTIKVDCPHFVVASMGCYGAALADGSEYTGNYPDIHSEQDLIDFHQHKTQIFLAQNPDGIALETVPCVQECRAFVSLLEECKKSSPLPACWISLACRNGQELNDGSKLQDALKAIDEMDPDAELIQAIGVNCCDSQHILSLATIMATHMAANRRRGLVIYPNSGEEWDAQTKTWKEGTGLRRDDLQDVFATRLMEAATVVDKVWAEHCSEDEPPKMILGGCCRTRPETIRALRTQVDQYQRSRPKKKTAEPATLTAEQQRKLAAIMGRDADFDRQLGEIGDSLEDIAGIQQLQSEEVRKQTTATEKANRK